MGVQRFLCGDGMHFYHESINGRKIAGCLLGLLGVFVVNLGKGVLAVRSPFLGEGFMLCSAVSSALGSLCNKEAAKKMGPVTLCGWQLILGAVLLIGVGFLFGGRISILEVPATGWLLLLYLAFLSAAAFSLWTVLLKYNPMGRVTVFNFLNSGIWKPLISYFSERQPMECKYAFCTFACMCRNLFSQP